MKKQLELMRYFVYAVLMLAVWLVPQDVRAQDLASAQPQDTAETTAMHCTVHLSPVEAPDEKSQVLNAECFDTFSDAMYAATRGRVNLPVDIEPGDVTDEMIGGHEKGGSYVLAVDFNWKRFRTGGGTLTYTGNVPCYPYYYVWDHMPSGWNNKVGSTKSYSGCSDNTLYDYSHLNLNGGHFNCGNPWGNTSCSGVNDLNNDASSRYFGAWGTHPH